MSYIGSTPTTQSFISGTDYFNGTGSQTAFTLSRNVASVNDVEAVVNNVVQRPNDAYTISGTTITFTSAPSAGTQNIYVRYLSTTTQSITPSQNTVSYATWDSDLRNETFAFKNRLINGDMNIDQRNNGASINLSSTPAYLVDRWQTRLGTSSGSTAVRSTTAPAGFTNSVLLTIGTGASPSASTGTNYFNQIIEGFNCADLGWGTANAQTLTLSFWVRSSLTGNFGVCIANEAINPSYPTSYTISAANTWEYKTITIPGPTSGTFATNNSGSIRIIFDWGNGSDLKGPANSWANADYRGGASGTTNICATSGATWFITGVQLEKGFTATNFDVLPYGTELSLCYRYFQRFLGSSSYEALPSYAIAGSGTSVEGFLAYKGTMRSTPTLAISTLCLLDANGIFPISGASATNNGLDSMRITYSGISSLTPFRSYYVTANNSTSAFLTLSAEL